MPVICNWFNDLTHSCYACLSRLRRQLPGSPRIILEGNPDPAILDCSVNVDMIWNVQLDGMEMYSVDHILATIAMYQCAVHTVDIGICNWHIVCIPKSLCMGGDRRDYWVSWLVKLSCVLILRILEIIHSEIWSTLQSLNKLAPLQDYIWFIILLPLHACH